jgi:hypothetical protein
VAVIVICSLGAGLDLEAVSVTELLPVVPWEEQALLCRFPFPTPPLSAVAGMVVASAAEITTIAATINAHRFIESPPFWQNMRANRALRTVLKDFGVGFELNGRKENHEDGQSIVLTPSRCFQYAICRSAARDGRRKENGR